MRVPFVGAFYMYQSSGLDLINRFERSVHKINIK